MEEVSFRQEGELRRTFAAEVISELTVAGTQRARHIHVGITAFQMKGMVASTKSLR